MMKTKNFKIFVISIIAGAFLLSAFLGAGHSLFKERKRLKRIVKQYALFLKPNVGKNNVQEKEDVYPDKPIVIEINAHKEIASINPLIYGSNLLPYSESETDIIQFIRETRFTIFRFPGGGSPGYHWKIGKSDYEKRANNAPLSQIDYVINFCTLTNTKLLIQINVESGTPQEAADWVAYMNKTGKFPVSYWQIGNEIFGDWDKAHMSSARYADTIKEYATAMKQVDPSVKIGMNWGPNTHDEKFNIDVMKRAGEAIDFVTYHWYPNHVNPKHKYKKTRIHPEPKNLMANSLQVPKIVDRIQEIGRKYGGKKEGTLEVTITEWDGAWDGPNFDFRPFSEGIALWSLANGIFHAETLAQFGQSGVSVSNQYVFQDINFGNIRGWDKEGGWGGSRWDGVSIRPKALALKMMSNYYGDVAVSTRVSESPYYFKAADWWPDSYAGEVPYISAYASTWNDKDKLSLLLINKHADKDLAVNIKLKDFKPSSTAIFHVLTGPSLRASNERNPATVGLKSYVIRKITQDFKLNVPARSAGIIQFSEEGSLNEK